MFSWCVLGGVFMEYACGVCVECVVYMCVCVSQWQRSKRELDPHFAEQEILINSKTSTLYKDMKVNAKKCTKRVKNG